MVDMHNESHAIISLDKGMEFLRKWKLLSENGEPADPDPLRGRYNNHHQQRQKQIIILSRSVLQDITLLLM